MPIRKTFTLFAALHILLICNHIVNCQTNIGLARAVVNKMAARYAALSSYQDTGIVMNTGDALHGEGETVVRFKTYFTRPRFFRFDWVDYSSVTAEERLNVIWSDGKRTFGYYSWDNPAVEKYSTVGLGIASATGVSRGSAQTILSLLLKSVGGFRVIEVSNPWVVGEERFEGENCYIVRGTHPLNFPIDFWISKRDFLIRKLKEPKDDGTYEVEVHRDIKLNEKISRDLFNYALPRARALGASNGGRSPR